MKTLSLSFLLLLSSACAFSQDYGSSAPNAVTKPENFYARFEERTNAIQAQQPAWSVPLVTTYVGLWQVVRTDIVRQVAPARTSTWNFDNSKGINIIPVNHLEVAIDLPPYIQHNTTAADGWGDFSFLVKYRIASGNAKHGNYVMSAWALTTVPTGAAKNGSTNASVQPNFGVGKGWGNFMIQTHAGATLPTGTPATTAVGRPILWNLAAQYKYRKIFWPELESNATFFKGGPNDGKTQEFLTPGLLIGKCAIHPGDKRSRPGVGFGGGMQIATSHFHSYNHALILTARFVY
jgi:hypothetical protein